MWFDWCGGNNLKVFDFLVGFIVLLLCWCMGATILKLFFLFCFGFANVWRFDLKNTNWVDLLMHEGNNSKTLLMLWDLTFSINNSCFFWYSLIEAWATNLKVLSIFLFHLCMRVLVLESFVFFLDYVMHGDFTSLFKMWLSRLQK